MSQTNEIKQKLINKTIDPNQFLDEISKLDQMDSEHSECFEIVTILENPEIKNIFESEEQQIYADYLNILRNIYFHSFQNLVMKSKESTRALEYLRKAVYLNSKIKTVSSDDNDLFALYIESTLFYILGDIENLRRVFLLFEAQDKTDFLYQNIQIVESLMDGLLKYKNIDYDRDYKNS